MGSRPTIAYQPALDGVRAFAVVAVLLFHAGVIGFDGGYLGVSVFFTLSGYLITSLLVHEHDTTGGIDLGEFYARRVRRLLPAALLCLAAVAVLAALTDLFDGVADLRAHIVGSLFQVANWVFLVGDGSYQDLLARTAGTASPLEHFWSLAIEEQFYWVWPPIMLFLLRRVPRRRGQIMAVGTLTVLTSAAAPFIAATWGADAAYWATPARIAEILMGALLAIALTGRRVSDRVGLFAPVALVLLGAAIVLFPSAGGPAYGGALPLVAVASASLILGLQAPGPVRRLFERPAFVSVGRISYGLYLFHWPIYLIIHPDRIDVPGWSLLPVRLLVTFVVSIVSFRLIEQPVRTARRLSPSVTFAMAAASTVALLVAAVTSVSPRLGEYWLADAATAEAASIEVVDEPLRPLVGGAGAATATTSTTTSTTSSTTSTVVPPEADTDGRGALARVRDEVGRAAPTDRGSSPISIPSTPPSSPAAAPAHPASSAPSSAPTSAPSSMPSGTDPSEERRAVPALPALSRPVRIVVIGDSTANAVGTGLVSWAAEHPELAQVEVVSASGCGFVEGGERRTGDTIAPIEGCDGWVDAFVHPAVERLQPDVVMAMVTSWDLIDRRWDTERLLSPLDDAYAARISSDYEQLTSDLLALGASKVAFVRHPIPNVYWLPRVDAQEDPARHAVVYDTYATLTDDDRVHTIELDRWLHDEGLDTSEDVRPDGIHPTPIAATRIASEFLGEQLVRIAIGAPRD